jgi:S1-C subfamily serine protease
VHIGETAFIGLAIASQQSTYNQGVALAGAQAGTPAAEAGLAQGDTVTALNGKAVTTGTQIQEILVGLHPGDKVSISWTDTSGQSHTANITLTNGPAA